MIHPSETVRGFSESPVDERVALAATALVKATIGGGEIKKPVKLPTVGAGSLPTEHERHVNHGVNYRLYRWSVLPALDQAGIRNLGRAINEVRSEKTNRGFVFTQHFFDGAIIAEVQEISAMGSTIGYMPYIVGAQQSQELFDKLAQRFDIQPEEIHQKPYPGTEFISSADRSIFDTIQSVVPGAIAPRTKNSMFQNRDILPLLHSRFRAGQAADRERAVPRS